MDGSWGLFTDIIFHIMGTMKLEPLVPLVEIIISEQNTPKVFQHIVVFCTLLCLEFFVKKFSFYKNEVLWLSENVRLCNPNFLLNTSLLILLVENSILLFTRTKLPVWTKYLINGMTNFIEHLEFLGSGQKTQNTPSTELNFSCHKNSDII